MDMEAEFDRLLLFEQIRKEAEQTYKLNPLGADNLTRWGGALLELAQFQSVSHSKQMIQDAIIRFDGLRNMKLFGLLGMHTFHMSFWCLMFHVKTRYHFPGSSQVNIFGQVWMVFDDDCERGSSELT